MLPLLVLQMCNIFCSSVVAHYVSNLFRKSCIFNILVVSTFSSNFRWPVLRKICPLCTINLHCVRFTFFFAPSPIHASQRKKALQQIFADHRKSTIPDLQQAAFQVLGGLQLLCGTSWYQIYAIQGFRHPGSSNLHFQICPIQIGQIWKLSNVRALLQSR